MSKKVLIQVSGTQNYLEDDTNDRMDFTTLGTFHQREGAYYIVYRESNLSGMEGVTTSLKVEAAKVTLNRMGSVDFKQVFERGIFYRSAYNTPQGTFYLGAVAEKIEIDLTEQGGHITLEYKLYADEIEMSQNTLRIIIKEDAPQ